MYHVEHFCKLSYGTNHDGLHFTDFSAFDTMSYFLSRIRLFSYERQRKDINFKPEAAFSKEQQKQDRTCVEIKPKEIEDMDDWKLTIFMLTFFFKFSRLLTFNIFNDLYVSNEI